jgi:hypothetical protein
MPWVIMPCVIMPCVIMPSIMLSVFVSSVIMLSSIMPIVTMLNVVSPFCWYDYFFPCTTNNLKINFGHKRPIV